MTHILDLAITTVVYLASGFILFFIGKMVYQLFHRNINIKDELVHKDNFAFAISHTGYFVGLLLAIGSAIIGPSNGLLIDLADIFIYGFIAILLLNISIIINDKIILRKFSVRKEIIDDQNAGTGVVEAANSIATGLIILGAVSGEGGGIMTALVFWAIGQIVILLISFVYDLITPYNIHEHIEKDNVAVGIGFAGAIIAIGNLIRFALMDDFESWATTLSFVGIEVLIGIILLPVVRFLSDKILLPGQKLTDEIINQEKPNIGAALIEAFSYIGGSVLLTWCM
ncbi:MAG: DUF350 domain-containing protein [Bacteroidetes bacterium]|jgi:uncharacterized membrane protein YjfL (UPF0719 family)|nr:DUF350 domain-containing protein [Bacteroidota bacterium]MBT6687889.1 DUF350 domain-containing protein [Bacteroidota bacterium]MBT7142463.1 DUF350 domain-containing protein [Bacteroidota bacterium]MBT7490030.1 DUF350 domain-containing protein [Bacteroidota bacterium]